MRYMSLNSFQHITNRQIPRSNISHFFHSTNPTVLDARKILIKQPGLWRKLKVKIIGHGGVVLHSFPVGGGVRFLDAIVWEFQVAGDIWFLLLHFRVELEFLELLDMVRFFDSWWCAVDLGDSGGVLGFGCYALLLLSLLWLYPLILGSFFNFLIRCLITARLYMCWYIWFLLECWSNLITELICGMHTMIMIMGWVNGGLDLSTALALDRYQHFPATSLAAVFKYASKFCEGFHR